jgi:hypothetical protein
MAFEAVLPEEGPERRQVEASRFRPILRGARQEHEEEREGLHDGLFAGGVISCR